MCTGRIRARVSSAVPIAIGYISGRRVAFHKRSLDGSGKADALHTGSDSDRVWGVVFSLSCPHKSVLDTHEPGYRVEDVAVSANNGTIAASMYVAQEHLIDTSLDPYCWYHRFVVQGALEHRLPTPYVQQLEAIPVVTDQDAARRQLNASFLSC